VQYGWRVIQDTVNSTPNRIMFSPNRIAYVIEQFQFVLLALGGQSWDLYPILLPLFLNSSRVRSKNYAFEDAIFVSPSR